MPEPKVNIALARRIKDEMTKTICENIAYEFCDSDRAGFGDWLLHTGGEEYSISAKKQGKHGVVITAVTGSDEEEGIGGEAAKFELVISLRPIK